MVKAYLRYIYDDALGCISGAQSIIHNNLIYSAVAQYVIVLDFRTQNIKQKIMANEKNVFITQIAICKNKVAIGYQDGEIIIWGLQESKVLNKFVLHTSAINKLIFSKDELQLYSVIIKFIHFQKGGQDNIIAQWDLLGDCLQIKFSGHINQISGLQILEIEDTYKGLLRPFLISSAKDGLIKVIKKCFYLYQVWDPFYEQSIATLSSHHSEIPCITLCLHDDKQYLFVATNSEDVLIYEMILSAEGKLLIQEQGILKRSTFARPIQISLFLNRLYVLSNLIFFFITIHPASEKKIEIYRLKTKEKINKELKKNPEEKLSKFFALQIVLPIKFKANSFEVISHKEKSEQKLSILISYTKNLIEFKHLEKDGNWSQEEPAKSFVGIHGRISHLLLSENDDKLIAISERSCQVFDGNNSSMIQKINFEANITAAALLPKSRYLVLGNVNGQLELLDLQNGQIIQNLSSHKESICSIIVHEQLKSYKGIVVLTAGKDRSLNFHELFFNKSSKALSLLIVKQVQLKDDIKMVQVTKDGRFYGVSLMNNNVQFFYVDSHKLYLDLYGHSLPVLDFSISDDNILVATGGQDKNIKIWGLDFGDCKKTIKSHQAAITQIRFVNDTHYFFSASQDMTLKYWDGDSYQLVLQFDEALNQITSLAVGKIGDLFYFGTIDGIIRKFKQTKEQVFISEEEENRIEKILTNQLAQQETLEHNQNQQEQKQDLINKDLGDQAIKNLHIHESENLMNALDEYIKYQQEQEGEEIMTNENQELEMQRSIINKLAQVPSSYLNGVLRFCHQKYLGSMVELLSSEYAIRKYPFLVASIINYYLIKQGSFLLDQQIINKLVLIKENLQMLLKSQRKMVQYNIQVCNVKLDQISQKKLEIDFI